MAMIRRDVNDTVSTKDKVKVAVIDSGVDFGNDVELKGFIDLVPGYEECLPYYTDTVSYTHLDVYKRQFMTARVTKTRYTLTGALVATFAGAMVAVLLVGMS